jgi:hydroxymethylpyrimidine kinase/phosphomethylpyrimidine kinase
MTNTSSNNFYPTALTIAGSDSGGGAGIQADLRTFSAFGVYGCSVITAVTAQNPYEVARVDALPKEAVKAQLDSVIDSFAVSCVKTGMLHNASVIDVVADKLSDKNLPLVIDPVMISTSGFALLEESAIELFKERLLPMATWLTPNIPEAELLSGIKIDTLEDMSHAAKICSEKWECSCVVKGGHLNSDVEIITDAVCHSGKDFILSSPKLDIVECGHGTGCTFSAALTASIVYGMHWKKALSASKAFVFGSLAEAVLLGEKLEAMYPPTDSYTSEIQLDRVK